MNLLVLKDALWCKFGQQFHIRVKVTKMLLTSQSNPFFRQPVSAFKHLKACIAASCLYTFCKPYAFVFCFKLLACHFNIKARFL